MSKRTYDSITASSMDDLIAELNLRSAQFKIHVINILYNTVNYIAVYEVDA